MNSRSSPSIYRQWDVVKVRVNPADRDEHYVVIISPDEIIARGRTRVNILHGSTKRPGEKVAPNQVLLDEADGLERQTIVECAFFPVINLSSITMRVGNVTHERRRVILGTIAACLRGF